LEKIPVYGGAIEKHLLVYDVHMYQCIDIHWRFFMQVGTFIDDELTNVFWLAIVTVNELGACFPHRNIPEKFRPDPSTFYLVIVVTNRQTDRQTYAGDYIIPRESFRGDNEHGKLTDGAVAAK